MSASCAGASGQPYQVLHAANGRGSADNVIVSDPDLAYLMELGYERTQAVAALTQARGDVSKALQLLFEDLTGTQHTLADRLWGPGHVSCWLLMSDGCRLGLESCADSAIAACHISMNGLAGCTLENGPTVACRTACFQQQQHRVSGELWRWCGHVGGGEGSSAGHLWR